MGQLAFESGYELVFVDSDRALVDGLRTAGHYQVRLVGEQTREVTVDRFSIFHVDETGPFYQAFRRAPLVFTTVCPPNLNAVAEHLRPLLTRWLSEADPHARKDILCCENMNQGSTTLKGFICNSLSTAERQAIDTRVGFPDTMISRVVAAPTDPLSLLGEEYSEWTADRAAFRSPELPAIRTLDLVDDQPRYLQRKLYIHNTGHATIGYLGFIKGYTYVHEAASDPDILAHTKQAIEESGWAIQHEHGFPEAVIRDYRRALTDKVGCAELPDALTRVVRDPVRKLGPDERFFGPVRLMLKHGRQPEHLLYGACAAMLADIPGDAGSRTIRQTMEQGGVRRLLEELRVGVPDAVVQTIERLLPQVRQRFGAHA